MKYILTILALLCAVIAHGDDALYRKSIRIVESKDNPHCKPGALKELGAYQFREMTWRELTKESFRQARNPTVADVVAQRHIDRLRRSLKAAGIDPNNYNVALAWNAGLTKVLNGDAPPRAYEYATCVINTLESLQARQRATTVVAPTPAPAKAGPKFSLDNTQVVFTVKSPGSPTFNVDTPREMRSHRIVLAVMAAN